MTKQFHGDERLGYSGYGEKRGDIICDDGDRRQNRSRDDGGKRFDISVDDGRCGSRSKETSQYNS